MPDLDVVDCFTPAVMWTKTGTNRNAEPVLSAPQQVMVRWVSRKSVALDPQGNSIGVDATLAIAGVDVVVGSIFWHGTLASLGSPVVPPTSGIMEAVTSNRADDLRGLSIRREVGLKRFNDTLPTVNG